MCKFKKEERVEVKATGKKGIVQKVLPNIYFPEWLSPANYLVMIDGEKTPDVFTKKQLRRV